MTGLTIPEANRAAARKALQMGGAAWQARFMRHEILVARTVHGMQIEAQQEFSRAVVQPLLKAIAGAIGTFEPRGNDLIPEAFPEIAMLQREIKATVSQGSEAVRRLTEQRMADIARNEIAWQGQQTGQPLPASDESRIVRAVAQRPWLGDSTERWFGKMLSTPTADNVRAWINAGITQGLTTDEIVRGLRGTQAQVGILADKPATAIAALVRSAATHASSVSMIESFKAIGFDRYTWTATLSEKTCAVCGNLDGESFELGKGPVPPAHPNCRCAMRPDTGDEPEGKRASDEGPVPADLTYADWVDSQSAEAQDRIFGATRGKAYRAGKLKLEKMVGNDLEPLTVAELRDLDRI